MTPGLAGAQIDHDEAIAAFDRAIGNVCDTLSSRRGTGTEIESYVVKVAIAVGYVCGENDCLDDLVARQIYPNQLGAAV